MNETIKKLGEILRDNANTGGYWQSLDEYFSRHPISLEDAKALIPILETNAFIRGMMAHSLVEDGARHLAYWSD